MRAHLLVQAEFSVCVLVSCMAGWYVGKPCGMSFTGHLGKKGTLRVPTFLELYVSYMASGKVVMI